MGNNMGKKERRGTTRGRRSEIGKKKLKWMKIGKVLSWCQKATI